jgi:hypothetical protein
MTNRRAEIRIDVIDVRLILLTILAVTDIAGLHLWWRHKHLASIAVRAAAIDPCLLGVSEHVIACRARDA